MVSLRFLFLLLSTVVLGAVAPAELFAQVPRYTPPAGSPLPAALDYFRRDVGVLDPYNAFVAPRRQLRSQLDTMTAREYTGRREAAKEIASIRETIAAPTGVSGGFMNYSHYYSRSPVSRVTARR